MVKGNQRQCNKLKRRKMHFLLESLYYVLLGNKICYQIGARPDYHNSLRSSESYAHSYSKNKTRVNNKVNTRLLWNEVQNSRAAKSRYAYWRHTSELLTQNFLEKPFFRVTNSMIKLWFFHFWVTWKWKWKHKILISNDSHSKFFHWNEILHSSELLEKNIGN